MANGYQFLTNINNRNLNTYNLAAKNINKMFPGEKIISISGKAFDSGGHKIDNSSSVWYKCSDEVLQLFHNEVDICGYEIAGNRWFVFCKMKNSERFTKFTEISVNQYDDLRSKINEEVTVKKTKVNNGEAVRGVVLKKFSTNIIFLDECHYFHAF